jgi:zinc protease
MHARTADRSADPRPVRSVGGIEEYRFDRNGLRLLYLPIAGMPVALAMLTYAVGSRHEPAGLKGASHMLEHMMFKGTPRFCRERGRSVHESLLPLGAQTNATTWLDRTQYFTLVPEPHLALVAEIEADRMRHLRLAPEDLEAERGVVLNEHDQCNADPLEQTHLALWNAAYPHHPYGHPVLGTREDIAGLEREALLAYYRRHYRPDRATLSVIGGVERERALEIARRHFGGLAADTAEAPREPAPEPAQTAERRRTLRAADAADWVMLGYRSPSAASADVDALDVLGDVLLGGKLSRLYRPLLGSGLATAAWCSVSRLRDEGLFQVMAQPAQPGDHARIERLLREAIDAIRRDGVSGEELARARSRLLGRLATSRDGPAAIAMQLNEAIAAGDWTAYATAPQRIEAVTAADVQRVAVRHLHDAGLSVVHRLQDDAGAEA